MSAYLYPQVGHPLAKHEGIVDPLPRFMTQSLWAHGLSIIGVICLSLIIFTQTHARIGFIALPVPLYGGFKTRPHM